MRVRGGDVPGGLRRRDRRRAALVLAPLAATAVLSACGGSAGGSGHAASGGSAASKPAAAAPTSARAASRPAALLSAPPTAHYVLMCTVGQASGASTLTWLDSSTLQVLYREAITPPADAPIPAYDAKAAAGFAPILPGAANTASPSIHSAAADCGGWQLGADGASIAGLDLRNGSAVPATYNLVSGRVTDGAQPAGRPVEYLGAYYAPDGRSLWSLQCDAAAGRLTVHRPDGAVAAAPPSVDEQKYGSTYCGSGAMLATSLIWLPGAATPTVFTDASSVNDDRIDIGAPPYNLDAIPLKSGGKPVRLTAAQAAGLPLLDPATLPESTWTYGYIHRSPDGSKAAFIAHDDGSGTWALFTVDGAATDTPEESDGTLPCSDTCGDVLAYHP